MHSVVGFAVFGVEWQFLKPYIVFGLALGGAYALSGVGIVVLYQTTGVLNVAFGAVGAAGALIAYWMIHHTGAARLARLPHLHRCSAGSSTSLYGVVFGPAFAKRDPLVKMMGTLALALILLGTDGMARSGGRGFRALPDATHLESPLGDLRREREPHADPRARRSRSSSRPGRRRSCATRSSARRTARSPTTARSPPRSVSPSAASRPRRGSSPGSSAAPPACCWPISTPRSTTRRSRSS